MTRLPFAFALAWVLLAVSQTLAVVEVEMPLTQLVKDSQIVAVVSLEQVDHEAGRGALKLERALKGDELSTTIPIKLIRSMEGEGNPRDMLDRVQVGASLVLFVASLSPQEHQGFAYTNGSWFKLRGVGDLNQLKVVFQQGEPNLRKTFHGEAEELAKLLDAHLAGRGELPGLDKSVKPGLGPRRDETLPSAEPMAVVSDQIELGPAWRADDHGQAGSTAAIANYLVVALLLIAGLGLVFMLTRSLPGGSA